MNKNPAKNIIEKIRKEKIIPQSKLFLNWKSYVFWLVWVLTLLLGALFFSFIILNLLDISPRVINQLGMGKIMFILIRTAPYLWIILAIVAVTSGFLAIRKTKRGYRYSVLFTTSLGVLAVVMFGSIFHLAKVNKHLGNKIFMGPPLQRDLAFPNKKRWQIPKEGLLGGEIIDIKDSFLELRSFDDEKWEVFYSAKTKIKIKDMRSSMMIEIVGEKIGENQFKAFLIQPFPFERRPGRR